MTQAEWLESKPVAWGGVVCLCNTYEGIAHHQHDVRFFTILGQVGQRPRLPSSQEAKSYEQQQQDRVAACSDRSRVSTITPTGHCFLT